MNRPVRAIFRDGVLKPLETLSIDENKIVLVTISPVPQSTNEIESTTCHDVSDSTFYDPLAKVRFRSGIADLSERFDDYRLGRDE
jgi:predicted DNA-binding antitoxin AbrB/MazE fold protein